MCIGQDGRALQQVIKTAQNIIGTHLPRISDISGCVYMDSHRSMMIGFLKYPVFVFEKLKYASWSALKETGILLHVYVLSRFLTTADNFHRPGFSQVM